jgi:ABC-type transport system involved in multi-copper enzyme maturation permease subunit
MQEPDDNSGSGLMRKTLLISMNEFKGLLLTKKVIVIASLYAITFILGMKLAKILDLAAYLLKSLKQPLPYSVLVPFYIGIVLIPFISLLSIYDSISHEFENKSIKYLAYRVPRLSIVIGKLFSPLLLITAINVVLYGSSIFYIKSLTGSFNFENMLGLFLFTTIYSLFFISIGLFFSISSNNPQRSLLNSLIVIIALFIVPKLPKISGILKYFSPMEFAKSSINVAKEFTLSGSLIIFLFLIYSIIIIFIAAKIFQKKDLY